MESLNAIWSVLLDATDGVVPVRDADKVVKLAHVDGEYFSLVAARIEHLDSEPDICHYNVAVPWLWALFREPSYSFSRPVAGLIRDPSKDCCAELSWAKVESRHKKDAIQLAAKAANLTVSIGGATSETVASAECFLDYIDSLWTSG